MPQYTIRNVPEALDRELRERSKQRGMSLNYATIDAIKRGLGIMESEVEYDDQALADQDTVDPDLWQ